MNTVEEKNYTLFLTIGRYVRRTVVKGQRNSKFDGSEFRKNGKITCGRGFWRRKK